MKNTQITIRSKLYMSVATLLVLLAVVGGLSIYSMSKIDAQVETSFQLSELVRSMQSRMIEHLQWAQDVETYLQSNEVNQLNVETDSHQCNLGLWYHGEGRAAAEQMLPGISTTLASLEEHHETVHSSAERIAAAKEAGNVEAAWEIFNSETYPALENVQGVLDEVIMNAQNEANTLKNGVNQLTNSMFYINSVLLAFAIAAATFIGFTLVRLIVAPLQETLAYAQTIADGDLTVALTETRTDEIGKLNEAMNNMRLNLASIIQNIHSASDQVSAGSQQLSTSSQSLSEAATEQASNLEEASSSLTQLSESIQNNANSSITAKDRASQTANNIKQGSKSVSENTEAMQTIAEKIKMVDEIAELTNLLSLNAAIEAARAGESGKGFAVVAGEVRKLAERSRIAAKEIGSIVAENLTNAEATNKQIEEIANNVDEMTRLVEDVNRACEEQSVAAQQVSESVRVLETTTQQNSSISEESAAASEELSAQAQQLLDQVNQFKLDSNQSMVSNSIMQKTAEAPRWQRNGHHQSHQSQKEDEEFHDDLFPEVTAN